VDIGNRYSLIFEKPLVKGVSAYDNFAWLQHELIRFEQRVINIKIDWEGQLGRTYLFLIMCLFYLANQYNKMLHVHVSKKIYNYLNDMKFLEEPQLSVTPRGDLRFRLLSQHEDTISMAMDIVENIPASLSTKLYEDMISRIGEMYNNAREHANAKHVLGCRYSKPGKKYCFACYDTGIGIVENVKEYHKNYGKSLTDKEALAWALAPFNSTVKGRRIPRGQGLNLLIEKFARTNRGKIRICSGKVLYEYNGETDMARYMDLRNCFLGTLFEMDINAFDGKYGYQEDNYDNN